MEKIIKTLEEWKKDLELRIKQTDQEIKSDEKMIKKKRSKILIFGEDIMELNNAIEKLKKNDKEGK